jgi:ferritin
MLSQKLQKAINDQINKELYSEYLYLSMASYFYSVNLDGFANWMMVQTKEEHYHAWKMFKFLNEKGVRAIMQPIEGPETKFLSAQDIFEKSLKHEQYVTQRINKLMDLAVKEKDHSAVSFLQWFVDEQVEEESSFGGVLEKIKLTGNKGPGLFMIDQELAKRAYVPAPDDFGQGGSGN